MSSFLIRTRQDRRNISWKFRAPQIFIGWNRLCYPQEYNGEGAMQETRIWGRELDTNFFFPNFSGTPGISRQKVWLPWVSKDILNFFAPHPFTWKTHTPPEDIRTKKLKFGFPFLPWSNGITILTQPVTSEIPKLKRCNGDVQVAKINSKSTFPLTLHVLLCRYWSKRVLKTSCAWFFRRMRHFCLQLEASCLQWSFFTYSWEFGLFYLQLKRFCLQF